MPAYLVERALPGAELGCLAALSQAAEGACRASTAAGKPVRHLLSTFTPGESRCRCLFEAASGDLVQEVNDAAQLPDSRIVLAVELVPDRSPTRPP